MPYLFVLFFVFSMNEIYSFGLSLKTVALTREKGENEKLSTLLRRQQIQAVEVPCLRFQLLNSEQLKSSLQCHDIVALTSPQAAKVFGNCWSSVGRPQINVVTVGSGTSKVISSFGVHPIFEPSEYTAKCLARELSSKWGSRVLYPASDLADSELTSQLNQRGFQTTRINTYSTVSESWTVEQTRLAESVDIAAFASPSAARVWKNRVGTAKIVVAIGPTTAKAATLLGFDEVHRPPGGSHGLQPFADLIAKLANHR